MIALRRTMAYNSDARSRTDSLAMLPATEEAYAALEKKLLRKIDFRLMPVLVCMIVLKCVRVLTARSIPNNSPQLP